MYNSPYTAPFMGGGLGYTPPSASYQGIPQYPQPAPQPVQPAEQRRTNAEWIPVSSVQQVREHIVQPNQTLYFINNNKPEFYVKTSDNFGTSTLKAFRFDEINPDIQVLDVQDMASVNRKDLDTMNGRITALEEQLKKMTGGAKHEPDYADDERK